MAVTLLLRFVCFVSIKLGELLNDLVRAGRRQSARTANDNGDEDVVCRDNGRNAEKANHAANDTQPRSNERNEPLELFILTHAVFDEVDHPIHHRRNRGNADKVKIFIQSIYNINNR